MHRFKATLLILATCGLSLHARAINDSCLQSDPPMVSDSLKTPAPSKLLTFGIFTLKAVKKKDGESKKRLILSED